MRKEIKELINEYNDRNFKEYFIVEYSFPNSLNLIDSLIGIGNELFKDARSRNELESKSIDDFFRSKARTIFRKKIE